MSGTPELGPAGPNERPASNTSPTRLDARQRPKRADSNLMPFWFKSARPVRVQGKCQVGKRQEPFRGLRGFTQIWCHPPGSAPR